MRTKRKGPFIRRLTLRIPLLPRTEKFALRSLLRLTVSARAVVYGLVFPGLWMLFESGWVGSLSVFMFTSALPNAPHVPVRAAMCLQGNSWVFQALFLTFIVIDGAAVAMANVVAIDCGGVDLVGEPRVFLAALPEFDAVMSFVHSLRSA